MKDEVDPLAAEREFFTALVEADLDALDRLLVEDFILVDVMSGSEVTKSALLSVVASGQLVFESIEPVESRVRFYRATAVVTGRTRMSGRFDGAPFTARSRYTHVYVEQQERWCLATAQGTQISDA